MLETFLQTLLQRWQMLTPRERRTIVVGAALLALALVWMVLFDPAWDARRRLQAELPVMRAQLAQAEQLADEARRLGAVAGAGDSPQAVKAQLEQSIEGAGLRPALAQLTLTGNLFELRFKKRALRSLACLAGGGRARDAAACGRRGRHPGDRRRRGFGAIGARDAAPGGALKCGCTPDGRWPMHSSGCWGLRSRWWPPRRPASPI
ncbi:MAG: type II secretion system protein M [Burkholderiaceae bacterium]|nr:type II secretion system protein M [Burkholderiaceae bacterium]